MNRTVKDATVRTFHYETLNSLKARLDTFITACNFAKHLKSLRSRTPFQAICDAAAFAMLWPAAEGLSFNCPAGSAPAAGSPFGYSGAVVTSSIPAGVGSATIDAVGGDGGSNGGSGAQVAATVTVAAGGTLYILVGGFGASVVAGGGGSFSATTPSTATSDTTSGGAHNNGSVTVCYGANAVPTLSWYARGSSSSCS